MSPPSVGHAKSQRIRFFKQSSAVPPVQQPAPVSAQQAASQLAVLSSSDPSNSARQSDRAMTAKTKTKIKPLLRKLRTQDANSLDLSRPAAENDGLGIFGVSIGGDPRFAGDTLGSTTGRRGIHYHHNRSTSAASQFSTATASSSMGRTTYVHPMRQTPRPYTPPIAQSYTTSVFGSDVSGDAAAAADVWNKDDDYTRRIGIVREVPARGLPTQSYLPSHMQSPPVLHHLDTASGSMTQYATESQSNLAGTPSSYHRLRADTLSPVGTTSPTSRSSFDMAFRPRRRSSVDPASRAASIRAAREAFSEREAAKAEKAAREERKQLRKRERREAEQRAKAERRGSAARASTTPLATVTPIAAAAMTTSYSAYEEKAGGSVAEMRYASSLHGHGAGHTAEYGSGTGDYHHRYAAHHHHHHRPSSPVSEHSVHRPNSIKLTWVYFITWLRTRLLRLRRKMGRRS